VTSG
jgi:hypothetical protein